MLCKGAIVHAGVITCRLSSCAGETGWDIFALHYVVKTPLNTVISPAHMDIYNRLFSFLWRLKRVEYTLSNTWCKHMTASHQLRVRPAHGYYSVVVVGRVLMLTVAVVAVVLLSLVLQGQPALRRVLHRCHILRTKMANFASTLASYVMFEVRAPCSDGRNRPIVTRSASRCSDDVVWRFRCWRLPGGSW